MMPKAFSYIFEKKTESSWKAFVENEQWYLVSQACFLSAQYVPSQVIKKVSS